MTCCTSILNLGCIYSCDTIQIGVNAPASGTYTIELQPDGIKAVSTENTIATPLVFSGGNLNEDAVHVFKIIKPDGTYYETSGGEDCFKVEIRPTTNATLANTDVEPVGCDVATAVLKNTAGTTISTTEIDSGASEDITAPNATAVLKDSSGATISTTPIPSNTSANITAPDGTINNRNADGDLIGAVTVKSGETKNNTIANVSWTDSDGSSESTPYGDAIVCTAQVKDLELFFSFDATHDTSALATNTGTTWTLTALAQDGGSGTITVSINGGSYAAFVNPTSVTNGQTVQVKRTTTSSAGSVTITGTYA